jgi:N6-L-threonylcarbamoyladenine synthase
MADRGNANAFAFPRSLIHEPNYRFSFSGLKTAVRYALVGQGAHDFSTLSISDKMKADVCASFQAAVVDVLASKSLRAVREQQCRRLIVGGGVAINQALRRRLTTDGVTHRFEVVLAPSKLCTDNAVMGALALEKRKRGEFASLDCDIHAGLQRGY